MLKPSLYFKSFTRADISGSVESGKKAEFLHVKISDLNNCGKRVRRPSSQHKAGGSAQKQLDWAIKRLRLLLLSPAASQQAVGHLPRNLAELAMKV